jgi:hypothetical protein
LRGWFFRQKFAGRLKLVPAVLENVRGNPDNPEHNGNPEDH